MKALLAFVLAFMLIGCSSARIVTLPGDATLLAARDAELEIRVDASGNTTIKVLEGTVEVRSSPEQEPRLVHAGETFVLGPRGEDKVDPHTGEPISGGSSRKPRPPRPPEH